MSSTFSKGTRVSKKSLIKILSQKHVMAFIKKDKQRLNGTQMLTIQIYKDRWAKEADMSYELLSYDEDLERFGVIIEKKKRK